MTEYCSSLFQQARIGSLERMASVIFISIVLIFVTCFSKYISAHVPYNQLVKLQWKINCLFSCCIVLSFCSIKFPFYGINFPFSS